VKKVILGIIIAVLLIVVIAVLVVDVKYEALRSSPITSHESVATDGDTLRVVFHPMLMKDLIAAQIPEDSNIPGWAVDKGVPREMAALISPDLQAGRMGVTVFVNEQRLGPVLAEESTTSNISGQVPYISWDTKGLVHEKRGSMTMRGSAPIADPICKAAVSQWGTVEPLKPIPIEGGHLFEALLDNRDGASFAVITTLAAAGAKGAVPVNPKDLAVNLYPAYSLRITADRVPSDQVEPDDGEVLTIKLQIECNPRAEENAIGTMAFLLDMIRGQLAAEVQKAYGAELSGKTERQGLTIISDMTLKHFEKVVAKLAGAS
jgi:hypothetical protein